MDSSLSFDPLSAQDSVQSPKTLIFPHSQILRISDDSSRLSPPPGQCSPQAPLTCEVSSVGTPNSSSSAPTSPSRDPSDYTERNPSYHYSSPQRGIEQQQQPKPGKEGPCGEDYDLVVKDAEGSPSLLNIDGNWGSWPSSLAPNGNSNHCCLSPQFDDSSSVLANESDRRKPMMSDFNFDETVPEPFLSALPPPLGAGLANLGNTCFLNAIFQCFTHTVPFVQGLCTLGQSIHDHHEDGEFCMLSAVREHMYLAFSSSGNVVFPWTIVNNLSNISSAFQRNQQEDAHEFLQCVLDKLDICWSRCNYIPKRGILARDGLVKQVFGGRLVSQLHCCECGHLSKTYEPLIDLSLEIEDVDDLDGALKSFTKVEKIEDTDVKITCDNCKEKVPVDKQLMIDQAPSVIAFHLKRFKSNGYYVEKIDKAVQYPLELNLEPYTVGGQIRNMELQYELYAVVVHMGWSPNSGHYFSYIRASAEEWYLFDDSKVINVQPEVALSESAYILFYAKKGTAWPCSLVEALHSYGIWNTSPKSVLDYMDPRDVSSGHGACLYPGNVSGIGDAKEDSCLVITNGRADEVREAGTVVVDDKEGLSKRPSTINLSPKFDRTNDAEIGEHINGKTPERMCGVMCEDDSVAANKYGKEKKLSNTSLKRAKANHYSGWDIDEIGNKSYFHSAPASSRRSKSPDIYSEEKPEAITIRALPNDSKMQNRVPSGKQLNKKTDRKMKEALRAVQRLPSSSRRLMFTAALFADEGSASKKRRQSGI